MQGMITLTYVIDKEDDQFVALCRELDVSSYGDSVEDAVEHLQEAVELYLDVIEADGERERIFRERGIEVVPRLEAEYDVVVRGVHPNEYATVRQVPLPA